MRILDRYILRSQLVPLAYCLLAFGMLFVVWDLFDHMSDFIEARTGAAIVALYYLGLLLPTLEFLAPASLLLATLYALWQLSRNNELIAMRASGVSLRRIILPILGVGLLFSLGSAVIKETVGTKAFIWTTKLQDNDFRGIGRELPIQLAYYNDTDRRLWLIDLYRRDQPEFLRRFKITQERPDGSRIVDWLVDEARWLDGEWWFYNLKIQHYDDNDNPLGPPVPAIPGDDVTVKAMPFLSETPGTLLREAKNWLFLSTWDMIKYIRQHPNLSKEARVQKIYDVHSRLAMPWACLIVTLFGIPVGARSGRQNVLTAIFLALCTFFAYYALSQIGLFLGKTGLVEPWIGAWLSNIVFMATGIVLIITMR